MMSKPESSFPDPADRHIYWIDLIRAIAVFQVILIHISFPIFYKEELPGTYWIAANFYDSLSRMGVPLFFMVSGYLLLAKMEPLAVFFRKRLIKVLVPTIFWSIFYLLINQPAYLSGDMSLVAVFLSVLKAIYTGNLEIHLWFLYVLIGIYFVVPILREYVSAASPKNLIYFLLAWLLASPGLELMDRITGFKAAIEIPVVVGFVGYFMSGLVLGRLQRGRFNRLGLILLGVLAIAGTFFGTGLLTLKAGTLDGYLYGYFSPTVVLMTACAFLLLKDVKLPLALRRRVRSVAEASFGIYLIHIFVIELFRNGSFGFRLYSWMANPFFMIPLTAASVMLVSFLVVYIIRKIPVAKALVP